MPVAPVDPKGTVLYYEDSGPPGLSNYLTIVFIHGLVFHGAIYRRLLPFAASYRLRLVFLNMRDYPGSSRFTQEELDAIGNSEQNIQAAAIRTQGQEVATFLEYFVTTHSIPELSEIEGRKSGGLALVGWSLSNLVTMAMLGHAESLPKETKDMLGRYLRTVVLYDPSTTTVGGPRLEGLYHPLRDPVLTHQERLEQFRDWISFYFDPISDLDLVTEASLLKRKPVHEVPPGETADPTKTPTVARMTTQEYESVADPGVFNRSYVSLRLLSQKTYGDNLRRALFDTGGVWSGVKTLLVWCDMSVSDSVWAAKHVQALSTANDHDRIARQIEFARLAGGNHFAHWDYPKELIRLLVERL